MKKILTLALVLMMVLTLAACGADKAKIEENNATVQAKVDEAEAACLAVTNFYKDNGFLEGETAAQAQPIVDSLTAQMETIKATHQKNLDAGGYSDDVAAETVEVLDKNIATYTDALAKLEALMPAE